jgi:hypothetical protein
MSIDTNAQRIFGAKRPRIMDNNNQNGEPLSATLRRVDAEMALEQAVEQAVSEPAESADLAPSQQAVATEHAHTLVTSITTNALGELRQLRDQIDGLIKNVSDRRDLLVDAITRHAEFADAAIAHKVIISEHIVRMRAEFDQSLTPLPPAPQLAKRR